MKLSKLCHLLFVVPLLVLASCAKSGSTGEFDPPSDPTDYDGYYADTNIYDETSGSNSVLLSLHNLMMTTHTYYNTYSEVWTYSPGGADIDENGKFVLFWSGRALDSSTSESWVREHVWPRANSNNLFSSSAITNTATARGAFSDLYHIRPTNYDTNSAHWNWKYCNMDDLTASREVEEIIEYDVVSGYISAGNRAFEPIDEFKGDTARILMYIYMHYNTFSELSNEYCGTLGIPNVIHDDYSLTEMYELLVEWNELDPPSELEKMRNNYVQTIQGNRNPFVDYPYLVNWVLGVDL